mgnify:FL=1
MSTQRVEVKSPGGIGFGGLLAAIFITLKLTGVIAWSWWWVLAPLWLPFAVFLVFAVVAMLVVVIVHSVK